MRNDNNNMPTVGVITLFGDFNYGNKLQLYAVMNIWKKLDFAPTFLQYNPLASSLMPLKNFVRVISGNDSVVRPEALSSSGRIAAFKRFNEMIPGREVKKPNRHLAQEFDLFSVGSDQVWNVGSVSVPKGEVLLFKLYRILIRPWRHRRLIDWFFLRFVEPAQRVALVPSIGMDVVSENGAKLIREGVSGFKRLSVREKRGAEIIRECSGREAQVLCDPTIMLDADEWRRVADIRLTPDEPYVFAYLLGDGIEAEEVLDKVSGSGEVPVIRMSDHMKEGEPDAGPAEFISLVDHATHVVTDSFHASVFSMLLGTPLTIVHREAKGDAGNMFSRLESLADTYHISDKIYNSDSFNLAAADKYVNASTAIALERAKFWDYLSQCLDDAGYGEEAAQARVLSRMAHSE